MPEILLLNGTVLRGRVNFFCSFRRETSPSTSLMQREDPLRSKSSIQISVSFNDKNDKDCIAGENPFSTELSLNTLRVFRPIESSKPQLFFLNVSTLAWRQSGQYPRFVQKSNT